MFQPGAETDVLIRFSTVAGERGSPDTWRDPRGFAVKFYTSEGNLDIVGNNTPVFFIRDPMKFQHFIRSQKRRADNNLRDHDMQWDFWTLSPESAHQVTWLMGDRGIPRTWRHMNGYSSHTYMWINADGERFWVKYHFKTDQGIECFTQDEADQMAAVDTDYHQRDLYEHIADGEFPSWTLKMQIMPFDDAKTYRFNPFDLTKVWPHGDYPLHEVGTLTLNRNVTDYHTEMEQAAFEPNNLVAGTGLSPDKMLLARGFSYSDAHRARLGVNYKQIPVNSPHVEVHSYSKDGAMRIKNVSRPGVRAELLRRPEGRPGAHRRRRALVLRRRDGARRVHAARRRRRLGPGRHDGARGARRRRPRPAGRQHRRPPAQRRQRAGAATGPSSTGATSTRTSATAWSRVCAPRPTRRTRRRRSRPTRRVRARRPRPDRPAARHLRARRRHPPLATKKPTTTTPRPMPILIRVDTTSPWKPCRSMSR